MTERVFSWHHSRQWRAIFLMSLALIGGLVAWKVWDEFPVATRKYISDVERKAA